MSVPATPFRDDYTGDDSTNVYAYSYKVLAETWHKITVRDPDTDGEAELVLGTDYSVSGVGNKTGGNITLIDDGQDWISASGYLDTGWEFSTRIYVPVKQITDIRNQGDFFPETHEDALDYLTIICKQQQDEIDRCFKLGETYDSADLDTLSEALETINTAVIAAEAAKDAAEAAADKITVSASEPSSPSNGDVWIDIS